MKDSFIASCNFPKNIFLSKIFILVISATLGSAYAFNNVFAQTAELSQSSLYVPLIGITSVPDPLALPKGAGDVTYHYAVKNFLAGLPLTNIQVVDNKCSQVEFVEGDDNNDAKLDYSETWRYICTTNLTTTTESIATATGVANDITTSHKAYATVVVGSDSLPPLVSIVNVTKVAYPLSLPTDGGNILLPIKLIILAWCR